MLSCSFIREGGHSLLMRVLDYSSKRITFNLMSEDKKTLTMHRAQGRAFEQREQKVQRPRGQIKADVFEARKRVHLSGRNWGRREIVTNFKNQFQLTKANLLFRWRTAKDIFSQSQGGLRIPAPCTLSSHRLPVLEVNKYHRGGVSYSSSFS